MIQASEIRGHMDVVGSGGGHLGRVDHMEEDKGCLTLTKGAWRETHQGFRLSPWRSPRPHGRLSSSRPERRRRGRPG